MEGFSCRHFSLDGIVFWVARLKPCPGSGGFVSVPGRASQAWGAPAARDLDPRAASGAAQRRKEWWFACRTGNRVCAAPCYDGASDMLLALSLCFRASLGSRTDLAPAILACKTTDSSDDLTGNVSMNSNWSVLECICWSQWQKRRPEPTLRLRIRWPAMYWRRDCHDCRSTSLHSIKASLFACFCCLHCLGGCARVEACSSLWTWPSWWRCRVMHHLTL